jgi:hypothetical protein
MLHTGVLSRRFSGRVLSRAFPRGFDTEVLLRFDTEVLWRFDTEVLLRFDTKVLLRVRHGGSAAGHLHVAPVTLPLDALTLA